MRYKLKRAAHGMDKLKKSHPHAVDDELNQKPTYEDKKLKRRVSDAKCRANISAGFSVLRKQVYPKLSGIHAKISKEMVLNKSCMHMKYLEGLLIALQHTKGIRNGDEDSLCQATPLQRLRNVQRQFVADQQRKGRVGCVPWSSQSVSTDTAVSEAETDGQAGQRSASSTGTKIFKRKASKRSSPAKHKRSPIIHLPPSLATPSRPQKRIKLAPTEPGQDQVVPILSSGSRVLAPLGLRCLAGQSAKSGSQTVPRSPCSQGQSSSLSPGSSETLLCYEGHHFTKQVVPSSPVIDVCSTPTKLEMAWRDAARRTPMKTYQIVGKSITPVKIDYVVENSKDMTVHSLGTVSPDLVCDEETSSWPDDDSSSSSGSLQEKLPVSCPWFSTPVRPTSLLLADRPPGVPTKQRPFPRRPKGKPGADRSSGNKSIVTKRKRLFKDSGWRRAEREDTSPVTKFEPGNGTPRKKYRKRATAARVRAWDPLTGRVLSPVQPYSGIFKSKQPLSSIKTSDAPARSPTDDPDFCLASYLRRMLPQPPADAALRPLRTGPWPRFSEEWDSEVEVEIADNGSMELFDEEMNVDVVEPSVGSDSGDLFSPRERYDDDPLPDDMALDLGSSSDSDPPCRQDVPLPPPTGTISPPNVPRSTTSPGAGCNYYASPELFQSSRLMWLRDSDGYHQAVDLPVLQANDHIEEGSFYDYPQHDRGCDPADACRAMRDPVEDDLFEADLGDVRHLDPALQPPSSSLESEDCIVRLNRHDYDDSLVPLINRHDDCLLRLNRDDLKELECIVVACDEDNNEAREDRVRPRGNAGPRSLAQPRRRSDGGVITKAMASFASSALRVSHSKKAGDDGSSARKRRNVRLNLPPVAPAVPDEDEDLNIWKFTRAALNEKDVLAFLPSDSTCSFLSNN